MSFVSNPESVARIILMVMVVVVGTRESAGAENTSDFGRISHELGHASDVVEKAMMMFNGIQKMAFSKRRYAPSTLCK